MTHFVMKVNRGFCDVMFVLVVVVVAFVCHYVEVKGVW